jgi:hypothetical protein
MRDNLGVRVTQKADALCLEFALELEMIFDDAVMNDGNVPSDVRMCVWLTGTAVRRPARVSDAECTLEILGFGSAR